MSYSAYAKYKETGIDTLSKIPIGWSICRLKFMAKIKNGKDYKEVVADEGYPVIQGKRMTFAVNIVNDEVIIITTSIIAKNYQ